MSYLKGNSIGRINTSKRFDSQYTSIELSIVSSINMPPVDLMNSLLFNRNQFESLEVNCQSHVSRAKMLTNRSKADISPSFNTAMSSVVAPIVDSTAVFKPDIFKGKVLFCTGGGSGICRGMTEAVV